MRPSFRNVSRPEPGLLPWLLGATVVLLAAVPCLCAPKVRAEKEYAEHEKIILRAEDVSSKSAQFLWDIDGDAQTEEVGNKLYVWARPGTYRVTLTAVDFDSKKIERARFTFKVNGKNGPTPPGPGPTPPGPPGPGPTKGPLRALVVFEEAEASTYPKETHSILYGKRFADALNAKTTDDPGFKGRKRWNVWDKDVNATAAPKEWQDALAKAKKTSLPWIYLFGDNGAVYHEGPLPKTVDEAISLVDKYAPRAGKKTSSLRPLRPGDYAAATPSSLKKAG